MIKGISDIRRTIRLGKIHLGIKKVNSKGVEYPSAVDYFVVPDEVKKVYGEEPIKLDVILPSNNPEEFFPQFYKKYGSGGKLGCKGDGETATRSGEEGEVIEVECDPENCEFYKKGDCKMVGNLLVILPKVRGFGVYQIDTSSKNNIINLNSEISLLQQALHGKISGVPLELVRETAEMQKDGKMRKVALIHLRSPFSINELLNKENPLKLDSPKEAEEVKEVKTEKKKEYPTKPFGSDLISDKQRKAIYAISKAKDIDEEVLMMTVQSLFLKESIGDLTKSEASKLIDKMQKEA